MGQHGVTGWWPVISAMLAMLLFYLRFGKETTPRPILQYKSTQVSFYFTYITSSTETDAPKGFILEHGPRLFTTAPLKCPNRIDGSYPQLKAGCLLKHPSGVPDELQTTFLPLMTESPRFQTRLSMTSFHTRAALMPLIPLTPLSVLRHSNSRLYRASFLDH